jgi:dipeptidyl aminopeptidase/acylaminoacyl peptidase
MRVLFVLLLTVTTHFVAASFCEAPAQSLPALSIQDPSLSSIERGFSVRDDVGFSHFGNLFEGDSLVSSAFSPDGVYFIVNTERGRLDLNRPETILRVFRTEDVKTFLGESHRTEEPSPIWTFSQSTCKNGPIVSNVRWLADSAGIAFLAKTASESKRLIVADLKTKTIHPLTPESQDVTAFDIRDANHAVYTVLSPEIGQRLNAEANAVSVVGTGRDLYNIIFPGDSHSEMQNFDRSELWAILAGERFRVDDKKSGRPLTIYSTGEQALALSPDGRSVVTALPVNAIPAAWETLYPPRYPFLRSRISPHEQNIEEFSGFGYLNEYVLIDLSKQMVNQLTNAPIGRDIGWTDAGVVHAAWSANQHLILLSNTFIPLGSSKVHEEMNRPCVAVFDLVGHTLTCLDRVKGQIGGDSKQELRQITSARFYPDDDGRILLSYVSFPGGSAGHTTYARSADGPWKSENSAELQDRPIEVRIKQGLNDPPLLVALDAITKTSRVIWNPNPQLKDMDLGEASIYNWKDKTGQSHTGGLYKPPRYVPGHHYPLVIQTHGFFRNQFIPSGLFPSAFAARELAGAGIIVLQVSDIEGCGTRLGSPEEATCAVATYEAAIEQLTRDGLIDPGNAGIVGFSRTSYYVMHALTTTTLHFKAASISDGFNGGYFQYLTTVDLNHNANTRETDVVIGSRPFGEGLRQWLERSPEFNVNKVTTPLQVVALNRATVLLVWEPYAELRALNKPVDLFVLPTGTHILSNPAGRMASQGATVDWFRFWLQDYEDPDPSKAEQYKRWRELRKMQEENDAKDKAAKEKAAAPN